MKKVVLIGLLALLSSYVFSQVAPTYLGKVNNTAEVRNLLQIDGLKDATGDSVVVTDANGKVKHHFLNFSAVGGSYSLPVASTSVLGGIKVDGTSVTIDGSNILHATAGAGGSEPVISATNIIKGYWNRYKAFVAFSTDSIPEGTTNKYYTDARNDAWVSAHYTPNTFHDAFGSLSNVLITSLATGDIIKWNGSKYVNFTPPYISANQNITVSGDATGFGNTTLVLALSNNAVTNSKLATMPTLTFKGNITGGTAAPTDVSISNIKIALGADQLNNTSDANKPVSTATQTALNLKANIDNQTFTGNTTLPRTTNVTLQTDTLSLFTFGAGSANTGDTLSFTTSTIYGSAFNAGTDTIIVTSVNAVMQGSSPVATIDIIWGTSLNIATNHLVNAGTAINSTSSGNTITVFDNNKVAPGNFIALKTTSLTPGSKPTYLSVTIIGYKKRKG